MVSLLLGGDLLVCNKTAVGFLSHVMFVLELPDVFVIEITTKHVVAALIG